ncbi:MAG: FeoB-associated Cys-rich membrane protein [Bacteroidales bacterium]|nr:FeoB-associated Cys-rich membrane protein [Bacteroidales bacterium]
MFTILIIVAAVFFGLRSVWRIFFPKKGSVNNYGCSGHCAGCLLSQNNAAKIVFKPVKID